MEKTIVEYFAEHEGYRCGYCKSPNTNFSHGMWAHTMTAEVYQGLINRGWRRSGQYLYKPTNNVTCCPLYTIRCNALEFKISKSQKKVLKKMNNKQPMDMEKRGGKMEHKLEKLETGEHLRMEISEIEKPEVSSCSQRKEDSIIRMESNSSVGSSAYEKREKDPEKLKKTNNGEKRNQRMNQVIAQTETRDNATEAGKIILKPCQKRRDFRLQKRKEKLEKQRKPTELINMNKEKSLKDLVLANDIQVELVSVESPEFDEVFEELHALYKKYQMKIHDDTEEECSTKQFKRFLCDSSLLKSGPYGSHHQLYRKGGNLIAVGVIDILPLCVSSVYFFYDPDLTHLSLGTYGALHEIYFVQQLNSMFNNIKYYYMGFYIHSCQKMRYKGNYSPSYLLCPEVYEWSLLNDELKRKLDQQKYIKLGTGEPLSQNVQDVMILHRRRIVSYKDYKADKDDEEIIQYCTLVGSNNASKILLYRK